MHPDIPSPESSNRKNVWLWALYDFANSFGFVGVLFYFGLWFVSDLHGSDVWMSSAVALSTIALLFTVPFLGRLSDDMGRRMPFLSSLSILCIFSLLALGLFGSTIGTLTIGRTVGIIALYFLFQYFYQAALAFYNAYLRDLSKGGKSVEKISGLGMAMGMAGNFIALALFFPIVQGRIPLSVLSGKPGAFVIAAMLFLVFALPVFFFLREPKHNAQKLGGFGKTVKATLEDFRRLRQYPGVLAYLIAFYLFADAMLTLSLFATLYMDVVGQLGDTQKNIAAGLGALGGIPTALLVPFFVRLCRGQKRALTILIGGWSILIFCMAFVRSPILLMFFMMLNGCAFGALFTLSRAFYATLVPEDKQAELFSVYILFERTASILGPLVWSGTAFLFASFGPDKYRFSMASLAILVALSLLALMKVREPSEKNVSQ